MLLLGSATDSSARYWVGGDGIWNGTNTANWSYYSGGPGGAPVPTLENNVYIDANSDIGTAFDIRVEGYNDCKSLYIFPDQFLEFVALSYGTSPRLRIYGGLSCTGNSSLLSFDSFYRCSIYFLAPSGTYIIDTKGLILAFGDFQFGNYAGSTAVYELLSDLNMRGDKNAWIDGSTGTVINTNGYTVYLPAGQASITINGAGTIYASAGYFEGFTFTGGPIVHIDNWATYEYDSYIQASNMLNGCSAVYIEMTEPIPDENFFYFNSFDITVPLYIKAPADSGMIKIWLGNSSGTMSNITILDTKINSRVFFYSDYTNTTLTVNSITNVSDIDFEGVSISGSAAPVSGTRIRKFRPSTSGTNINASTFTPKTVYWSNVNGGKLSSNSYSFTSGGTPSLSAFPFHLDTVIIDDAGLGEDATINISQHDQGPITVFTTFDCSTRTKPFYLGREDGWWTTSYYPLKDYNNTITCLSEFKLPVVPCLSIFSRVGFLIGCDLDFNITSTPMNFYGTYYPTSQDVNFNPAFLFYRPTTLYTNLDANYVILLNDFNFNSYSVTCKDIDLAGNGGNPTSTVYFGSSTIDTYELSNINIPTCPDIQLLNITYRLKSGAAYIGGNRGDIQYPFENTIPNTPRNINSLKIIPSNTTFTIYVFFIPTELELISSLSAGTLYFRHNQSEVVQPIKRFVVEGPSDNLIGPITLIGSPTKFNYIERNSISVKNTSVYGIYVYPDKTWYAVEGNVPMQDGNGWIFDSTIPVVSTVDTDNTIKSEQTLISIVGTNLSTADGVQLRQGNNILNTTNYVAGSSPTFTAPSLSSIFSSGIKFGTVQLDIMENI